MNNLNKEIPVNYNGEVIGYTADEGKTIIFNNEDSSKKLNELLKNKIVGVSSRAIGKIKSDNTIEEIEKISYDISSYGTINILHTKEELDKKKNNE